MDGSYSRNTSAPSKPSKTLRLDASHSLASEPCRQDKSHSTSSQLDSRTLDDEKSQRQKHHWARRFTNNPALEISSRLAVESNPDLVQAKSPICPWIYRQKKSTRSSECQHPALQASLCSEYFPTKCLMSSNRSSYRELSLEDFQFLKPIATGGYSEVWYTRSQQDGSAYVIKTLSMAKRHPEHMPREAFEREVRNLRLVGQRSVFITRIKAAFINKAYGFIALEYGSGGDLHDYLCSHGRIGEKQAKLYVGEIACGLDELHRKNIIFRDLKPENIVICADGHLKLTDLGLSKRIRSRTNSFCGTYQTMAPEIFLRKENGYSFEADWYSLGVCLYEMLLERTPFAEVLPNRAAFERAVVHKPLSFRHNLFQKGPSIKCKIFIRQLLEKDPSKRLVGLERVFSTSWLSSLEIERVIAKHYRPVYVPEPHKELNLSRFSKNFVEPNSLRYFLYHAFKA
ncbi:hypothetical protein O181_107007 [Austropuccinia psidii MF-1]|uniref:Protein kinase domain-containing protein n=1 Tax=Austropuccinia psidii MF-1 TaxID=1389203 RepID=A0A9Q3PNX9_9BASI|nr:hypothetical protein [Austropuccinia psidii MF-1]